MKKCRNLHTHKLIDLSINLEGFTLTNKKMGQNFFVFGNLIEHQKHFLQSIQTTFNHDLKGFSIHFRKISPNFRRSRKCLKCGTCN